MKLINIQSFYFTFPLHFFSIENAPAALASLFEGKNTGKLLVKVDDEVVTSGSSSL